MGRNRKIISVIASDEEAMMLKKNEKGKCCRRRGVSSCKECCRYDECYNNKPHDFGDAQVSVLVGAIVLSALQDYYAKIPPLKKCKTKAQKEKRNRLLYDKATAENFFKSKLFFYSGLNFEYISRKYKQYYEKKKV